MSHSLVGLTFRPSDQDSLPVYAVLEKKRGRIYFVDVGVLKDWEEIFEIGNFNRLAFNFLYVPDGFYRPPKFRLKMYVDTVSSVLHKAHERDVEIYPVYTYGFYARDGVVPSKSTLAGLHARFTRINEYITGLNRFRLLDYNWKILPSDLLDAIATALTLYFLDTGKGYFVEVDGIKVFVPE